MNIIKLPEQMLMHKRIGSTVYEVHVRFSQDAKETMTDKLLRLIKNDLNLISDHSKMGLPQTGRLPERSSA